MEKVLVEIINTEDLSQETISKIEDQMEYLGKEIIDEATFSVVANSKQELLKIFDFRLKFL